MSCTMSRATVSEVFSRRAASPIPTSMQPRPRLTTAGPDAGSSTTFGTPISHEKFATITMRTYRRQRSRAHR
jgi:hypothetical protein